MSTAAGSAAQKCQAKSVVRQLARSNLTTLTESADRAAHEYLAGGKLWAAGRQPDFIAEACGRAGGLMAMAPLGRLAPTNHDVLYAVPGLLDDGDRNRRMAGARHHRDRVQFLGGLFDQHFVDTVANIIELWTWTGNRWPPALAGANARAQKLRLPWPGAGTE
jgi:hypothetical protein